MTVQKRLFLSNILMLVIPAVLAVFMALGGLFLVFVSAFPHAEYRLGFQEELQEIRCQAVTLATDWLRELEGERKMKVKQHALGSVCFWLRVLRRDYGSAGENRD